MTLESYNYLSGTKISLTGDNLTYTMSSEGGKILMVDDDEDVLLAAKMLLKKQNHHVIIEKNPNKIPFLLNNDTYDVILLDMNFSKDITSGKEGFEWLKFIREKDPT